VEHLSAGYHRLRPSLPDRPGFHCILHPPGEGIHLGTRVGEAPTEALAACRAFYRFLEEMVRSSHYPPPRLLVVDQVNCLRVLSLEVLADAFDVVLFHDSQPTGLVRYSYDRYLASLDRTQWIDVVFRTFYVHTEILIRRRLVESGEVSMPDLHDQVWKATGEFCESFRPRGMVVWPVHRLEER
jgi:hypothetical protein